MASVMALQMSMFWQSRHQRESLTSVIFVMVRTLVVTVIPTGVSIQIVSLATYTPR